MSQVLSKPLDATTLRVILNSTLADRKTQSETCLEEADPLLDLAILKQHAEVLGKTQIETLYLEALEIMQSRTEVILGAADDEVALVEQEAHTLAGLCSSYGLSKMGAACAALEDTIEALPEATRQRDLAAIEATCIATTSAVRTALTRLA